MTARHGRNWLLVLVAVDALACALASGLSIGAVVALEPFKNPSVRSVVPLLGTPTWKEVAFYAEPALALAIVALLVRRRPGLGAGALAACLALAAVPGLWFIFWSGVLWSGCSSIPCDGTQAAVDELANAPGLVGDLTGLASLACLLAAPLTVVAAVWALVAGVRAKIYGDASQPDRV